MPKMLIVSAVAICAIVLFGYGSAAVLATDLGRASVALLAILIAASAVIQSMRLTIPAGRA